ncbi:MAG: CDP-diacylglycerol--glycerol-3-phosphate 3-phosphatidyltransferase [Gemmatimonadota bacterium]
MVLRRSTLPNIITVGRIVMAPAVMYLMFIPTFTARILSWLLFLIAAFSDLWDGYLARKHGWISNFGKLVDPIADKLLLACTFVPFYLISHRPGAQNELPLIGQLPMWVVLIVFGREIFITAVRSFAANRGLVIPAARAGKQKAVFQNIFAGVTIFWYALQSAAINHGWSGELWANWQILHGWLFLTSLALAVLLTVYSMVVYLIAWRKLAHSVP